MARCAPPVRGARATSSSLQGCARVRVPRSCCAAHADADRGTSWLQGAQIARQCHNLRGVVAALADAGGHVNGLVAGGVLHAVRLGLVAEADHAVVITRVGGRFHGTAVQLLDVGDTIRGRATGCVGGGVIGAGVTGATSALGRKLVSSVSTVA
jgi:hypothetical protein